MGLRGFGSFIKYSMFLFNAVILVAGCALVGFGIYTKTSSSGVSKFSSILGSNLLPTVSLILIVVGCVIIVLSFLGCCGAIKEVKCMLVLFFLLLLLFFIAFLAGGILIFAFKDKIEDVTLDHLRQQLDHSYGQEDEESVTEAWDSMQKLFKCCGLAGGVNSTESWAYYKTYTEWFQNNTEVAKLSRKLSLEYVPVSCCKDPENTPNVTKCQGLGDQTIIPVVGPPITEYQLNDQLYTQGCYTSLNELIQNNLYVLIGIGGGIALSMILGMVFAICLCRRIKDDDDYECD